MSTSIPHDSDLDLFGHLLEYQQTEEFKQEAEAAPVSRVRDPKKLRAASARYRQRHPEAVKLRGQSRKYGAELYEKQQGLCYWCGQPLGERYEVDHIKPITDGGTSAPTNLCVAHMRCNRKKYNKPLK